MAPVDLNVLHPGSGPRPVLLGMAGDSASGKSTLSQGIEYILGTDRVARLCTDDYHRFDRATRAELDVTPLDPAVNDIEVLEDHLRDLSLGRTVVKPFYDHANGTFGPKQEFAPAEILIVEGLLALTSRGVRDSLTVAVYLDPEETLRRAWKAERDVVQRGYTPQQVQAELARREADAEAFVRPQAGFADIVVRFHPERVEGRTALAARLVVRPTLPYPGLRELIGSLRRRGEEPIRWSTATDKRGPMSVLDIDGECPADLGGELEDVIWSYLHPDERLQRDMIGIVTSPDGSQRRSEALALAQLLIVSHLVGALDGSFEM